MLWTVGLEDILRNMIDMLIIETKIGTRKPPNMIET